jgi:hypothetical protein
MNHMIHVANYLTKLVGYIFAVRGNLYNEDALRLASYLIVVFDSSPWSTN